ncbi:ABC transporter permease [Bacillus timonensis]|nr:ABC transporter permease [Bacillus timonensis]
MNILTFTLRSLKGRKTNVIFTVLAIMIAVGLTLSVLMISSSVENGVKEQAGSYDLVVGAEGSPMQLVLNSLVYLDTPTGNIPYEIYENLMTDERVLRVVPLALGDSYRGFPIIGTNQDFFLPFREGLPERFHLTEGKWFSATGEVVLGAEVAKAGSFSVGDTFHGNHGIGSSGESHEELEYKVVGILERTGQGDDKGIFTPIESVWDVHAHDEVTGEDGEHAEDGEHSEEGEHAEDGEHSEEGEHAEDGEHTKNGEHAEVNEHSEDLMVTALLVKPEQLGYAPMLKEELDDLHEVQAVYPVKIFRQLLETFHAGKSIAILLAAVSIGMAILFIVFAVLNSIGQRIRETNILRALGVTRKKIIATSLLETVITALIGTVLGILLSLIVYYLASAYSMQLLGVHLSSAGIDGSVFLYSLYLFLLAVIVSILPMFTMYVKKVDGR